jgi:hypothetical protein
VQHSEQRRPRTSALVYSPLATKNPSEPIKVQVPRPASAPTRRRAPRQRMQSTGRRVPRAQAGRRYKKTSAADTNGVSPDASRLEAYMDEQRSAPQLPEHMLDEELGQLKQELNDLQQRAQTPTPTPTPQPQPEPEPQPQPQPYAAAPADAAEAERALVGQRARCGISCQPAEKVAD